MTDASMRLLVLTDLSELEPVTRAVQLVVAALPVDLDLDLVLALPHAPAPADQERARALAMTLGHDLMRVAGFSVAAAGGIERGHKDVVLEVGTPDATHASVLAVLRRLALHSPAAPNVVLTVTTI